MKKLLEILFFILFLINTSWADDISEFEIEGISVGDSLLDYVDKSEIIEILTADYPKSKKFGRFFKLFPNSIYDSTQVHVKVNDPKYIIYSVTGAIFFENNMRDCNRKRKEVFNEMTKVISGKVGNPGTKKHIDSEGDLRSTTYAKYIEVDGGFVDFVCTDWTKKYENKNSSDSFKVIINTDEFDKWLHEEAY